MTQKSISFFVPLNNDSVELMQVKGQLSDSDKILSDSFLNIENDISDEEFLLLPDPSNLFSDAFNAPQSTKIVSTPKHSSISTPSRPITMEKILKCREFSGYPQENASKFMSEFESYVTLYDLNSSDKRRIAAFHLHLKGPALTWFNSLSAEAKSTWSTIVILFKEKYVNFNWQSSTIMMTNEIFQNLHLAPGQSIEDFYCNLVEKGQILQKPDHEILSKFISGLPDKMSFFVRAGQPTDLQHALTSAKMAEACGYRKESEAINAIKSERKTSFAESSTQSDIQELKDQVKTLTAMVSDLKLGRPPQNENDHYPTNSLRRPYNNTRKSFPRQQQNISRRTSIECYGCRGNGHIQRDCNWTGSGRQNPTDICQLCMQNGHIAQACKLFMQGSPRQGNRMSPGDRHIPTGHSN